MAVYLAQVLSLVAAAFRMEAALYRQRLAMRDNENPMPEDLAQSFENIANDLDPPREVEKP